MEKEISPVACLTTISNKWAFMLKDFVSNSLIKCETLHESARENYDFQHESA